MTTVLCQLGRRITGEIAAAFPDLDVRSIGSGEGLEADAAGEVLVTSHWFAADFPTLFDRGVRWVHNFGTGVDQFPLELLGPDQVLTCSRGAGAGPISEWVITQMLAFEKRLPGSWITEPPEHWNLADLGTLKDSHVGIIGYGGIGQAVAQRALPFGSEVRAHRRRAIPSEDPDVEIVTDLLALAEWSDHLVVTAPATPETRHLVGTAVLDRLGPGPTWSTSPGVPSSTRTPCAPRSTTDGSRWPPSTPWSPSPCLKATGSTATPRSTSAPTSPGARPSATTASSASSSRSWPAGRPTSPW